jgi:hypothetical protein
MNTAFRRGVVKIRTKRERKADRAIAFGAVWLLLFYLLAGKWAWPTFSFGDNDRA